MQFEGTYPPLTAKDIDEFELNFGVRFPEDLRRHYLRVNGGEPIPSTFLIGEDRYDVQEFLAIKYAPAACSLEHMYRELVVENPHFPKDVIPFAVDPGGDFFLYNIANSDGQILFYNSEYYDDPERSLVLLAPSLSAFLDGLVEEDD